MRHLITPLLLCLSLHSVHADIVWDGSTSGNWNTSSNWDLNRVPNTTENTVFPVLTANKAMTNNRTAGTLFQKLVFKDDGYSLTGNALTLGTGGIELVDSNDFAGATTINLPITSTLNQTFFIGGTGASNDPHLVMTAPLSLSSNAAAAVPQQFKIVGGRGTFTGDINGPGADVEFSGSGIKTLNNATLKSAQMTGKVSLTGVLTAPTASLFGQLSGTGTVNARLTLFQFGVLNPGVTEFGRISLGGGLDTSNGRLVFDLGSPSTPGTTHDQIVMNSRVKVLTFADGTTQRPSVLDLKPGTGFSPAIGQIYKLFDVDQFNRIDSGTFTENTSGLINTGPAILSEGTTLRVGPSIMRISYSGGDGNDVTATVVDLPPQLSDVPNQTMLEEGTLAVSLTLSDQGSPISSVALSAVTSPPLGFGFTFEGSGNARTLQIRGASNFSGNVTVIVTMNDGRLTASKSFALTVTPVNDPPSFNGRNAFFIKDGGNQTVFPWATEISDGDGNLGGQTVSFQILSNSNPALFSVQPVVGTDGRLSCTPAPGVEGIATIQLRTVDNGGTSNGGNPNGATRSFVLSVSSSFQRNPTKTWRGTSFDWFSTTSWIPFVAPNSSDLVAFPASAVQKQVGANAQVSGMRFFGSGYQLQGVAIGFEGIEIGADGLMTVIGPIRVLQNQTWTLRRASVLSFAEGLEVDPGVTNLDVVFEDESTMVWPPSVSVQNLRIIGAGSSRPVDFGPNVLGRALGFGSNVTFDRNSTHVLDVQGVGLFVDSLTFFKGATLKSPNAHGAIHAGGRLEGGGTFGGNAPNAGLTLLNDGNSNAAVVVLELKSVALSQRLRMESNLIISGAKLELLATEGFSGTVGATYTLVDVQPGFSITGTFAGLPEQAVPTVAGVKLRISYVGGDGNDMTATVLEATPSLSDLSDQTVDEGTGAVSQTFTFTNAVSPTFTFESSDEAILPVANITVTGTGAFSRQLRVTPLSNANGTVSVTLTVNNGVESVSDSFDLNVLPVNDPPSFTNGPNLSVSRTAAPQFIDNWASNINVGPANEEGQSVTFEILDNSNPSLFSVPPAVNLLGNLSFTPNPASPGGSSTITLIVRDSGGTERGGIDTGAPQSFTISVTPANNPPTFNGAGDISAQAGQVISQPWATNISPGPATDEAGQSVAFLVETTSPELFSVQPTLSPSGVLSATLLSNALGSAQVFVQAQDDGGTANGGRDLSSTAAFTIRTGNVINATGSYYGLAVAPDGIAPAHVRSGFINVRITKPGAFSGKLTLGGRAYSLAGTFGNGGLAVFGRAGNFLPLARTGLPPLLLSLTFDTALGGDRVSGAVLDAGQPFAQVEANRAIYNVKTNPMLSWIVDGQGNNGKFTCVFPAQPAPNSGLNAAAFPQGDGWASLTIGKDGKATILGRLADNTTLSMTSFLTAENRVAFYASLYRGQGSFSGRAQYRNIETSDASGTDFLWFRPAQLLPRPAPLYPNGWPTGILVDVEASRLVAKAVPYLGALTNVDLDGNLLINVDGLSPKAANFTPLNKILLVTLPDTDKFTSTISSTTGRWTGSFTHPTDLKKKAFSGVILQKSNRATGFFIGPQGSERVSFQTSP